LVSSYNGSLLNVTFPALQNIQNALNEASVGDSIQAAVPFLMGQASPFLMVKGFNTTMFFMLTLIPWCFHKGCCFCCLFFLFLKMLARCSTKCLKRVVTNTKKKKLVLMFTMHNCD